MRASCTISVASCYKLYFSPCECVVMIRKCYNSSQGPRNRVEHWSKVFPPPPHAHTHFFQDVKKCPFSDMKVALFLDRLNCQ